MAKDTKSKNGNLGSFVDQVTPEPKIILENYLRLDQLALTMSTADDATKKLINEMIEIALSSNKQEEFLSLGEKIAINSLRKLNILV